MSSAPDRNVLICIDESKHSLRNFTWYIENFYQKGETIGLVHVHKSPDLPVGFGLHSGEFLSIDVYRKAVEHSVAQSKAAVKKFEDLCVEKGIECNVYAETQQGTIGSTICDIAQKSNGTVLVIGKRGKSLFRRTFLGSVSDYVLRYSSIPVIVVPPKNEQQLASSSK